ncbi:MAG: hypothetical protein KME31_08485 [Tolypothrix carrinoi HA7290-LM1]|jgi:hypothetical protein|nr:hypothetical protein [Tolypothrix carrinoi HA7290-LM1]
MPLPLILDKALSFGKQAAKGMLQAYAFANPAIAAGLSANALLLYSRLEGKAKQAFEPVVTTVKSLALPILAGTAVGLVVVGGVAAFSACASLGTVGALTASFLAAGAIGFTLTQVVSTVINTTNFVVNFNINQSDAELDAALTAKIESFYGLLGETVGSAVGYLVCGAIPGAVAFAFNPAVGAAIMRDLDDDAKNEIYGHVNGISRMAFQTLVNATLAEKFKSARRFLKKNPSNPFAKAVKNLIGEENWNKWGESNRPSWTIHQDVIEKRIEAIPDKGQRQFFEQALEGFADSCMEAGYIVANTLDSQLAAQVLMRQATLGNPTDVRISFA